jgi:succinate dehydrogenase/fumarate reductase flavoprotein subunit
MSAAAAPWDAEYDLVVLGAGAGGMTAALTGAIEGLRVLLVDSSRWIGGTTARSSGTVWIPDNPHMRLAGMKGDAEAARTYLEALAGERAESALIDAFLREGPRMIEYLEQHTDVRFQPYINYPDYRQALPGAASGGRPLEPLAFDGRTLGARFDDLAWPLPELMLLGGMMVTRGEAAQLLRAASSWAGFTLGARLVARYALDRLRYRRGTRLVLGNALAARLFRGLLDRSVAVRLGCLSRRLETGEGAGGTVVHGIALERDGKPVRIAARRGVVLAGGGFPASPELRARHLPAPVPEHTPAFEGCTGETIRLALDAGAALGPAGQDNALWFPSSIAKRHDGSTAVYPHIVLDRAKPGLVAVSAAGRRFVDEAVSYHEFTRAMYRTHRTTPTIPAWLVCDRRFVWKYGLGMIRPRTPFLGRFVASGYLKVADTIGALACSIGVDAAGLADTVRRHNEFARSGKDADFGKGSNAYDLANGDPAHEPNPCLGPIAQPPYCAVAVVPTPLGTSLGLRTDADAEVLDGAGRPIRGLYACGNDMHTFVGGEYPGAGAQLGPAMTFGYVAARHAARTRRATESIHL